MQPQSKAGNNGTGQPEHERKRTTLKNSDSLIPDFCEIAIKGCQTVEFSFLKKSIKVRYKYHNKLSNKSHYISTKNSISFLVNYRVSTLASRLWLRFFGRDICVIHDQAKSTHLAHAPTSQHALSKRFIGLKTRILRGTPTRIGAHSQCWHTPSLQVRP